MMVAAASRALLAKFHSWDATALLEPQELPGHDKLEGIHI